MEFEATEETRDLWMHECCVVHGDGGFVDASVELAMKAAVVMCVCEMTKNCWVNGVRIRSKSEG